MDRVSLGYVEPGNSKNAQREVVAYIYIYINMDGEIVGTERCVYFAMDNLRL